MTSDADGFLLVEVLIASAVVAAAFLAMTECVTTERLAERRRDRRTAMALCAEYRLAATSIGPEAPDLTCDPIVHLEREVAGGDVAEVRWKLSVEGTAPEIFTMVRHVR